MNALFPDAVPAGKHVTIEHSPAIQPSTELDRIVDASFQALVQQPVSTVRVAPSKPITDDDIDNLGMDNATGMSDISRKVMSIVKASDTDQLGTQLNQLIAHTKGLDPTKVNNGILGKVRNLFGNVKEKVLAEFSTVESRMDTLMVEMDKTATLHKSRIPDMEQLYNDNIAYKAGLLMDEQKGREMLIVLQQSIDAAQQAQDVFAAQEQQDLQRRYDRLEKRVDDFVRAQKLADLAAPQIRMMQDNARSLVERFRDIKVTTLPAYRNAFTLYILQLEQKKGAEMTEAISDATDAAIKLQGTLLRQNVVAVEKAKQRSIVSIQTLQQLQKDVIGAADDAKKIADEGRVARMAVQPQLVEMERELIKRFGTAK